MTTKSSSDKGDSSHKGDNSKTNNDNNHTSKQSQKNHEDETKVEKNAETNELHPQSEWSIALETLLPILIHLLAIIVYLLPLLHHHPHHEAVLDEMHILSDEQRDVKGESTLTEVFMNDYWGRPMKKADSHKSWRPVAILLFRYLKQNVGGRVDGWWFGVPMVNAVLVARLVGVIFHAVTAELVSLLACKLFPTTHPTQRILLRSLSKLFFALHPAHVEAVANAANRPHVLAVLSSMVCVDSGVHILLLMVVMVFGLLSCETAIFQVPAILLTMTVTKWKSKEPKTWGSLKTTMVDLLPRYFLVTVITACYLGGRILLGTTDIPEGLIRPAENPFYNFEGPRRIINYALVLSIHVAKSFCLDPVGFSHEYGYNCVPEVSSITSDIRLLMPFGMATFVILLLLVCLRTGLEATLMLLVGLAWMATLFPISGVLKVGTFIADRITIASTVVMALFGARLCTAWIIGRSNSTTNTKRRSVRIMGMTLRCIPVVCVLAIMWQRVHRRSLEWMTSPDLLESSLKNCPNSAKSNLEISKVYSGLYPEKLDMKRAMKYVKRAEEIDPDYCDVDWQMAQMLFKQQKYLVFEDRLTKSVLCEFTMGGAISLYDQYWKIVTSNPQSGEAARIRHAKHAKVIQEAVEAAKRKEDAKKADGGSKVVFGGDGGDEPIEVFEL